MTSRSLTAGETALARRVFGDAIDYGRVLVHARGFLPFGLQHPGTSMAPNGRLYCGARQYRGDFAACDAAGQMHFIHEMAHVWQHQLGYRVLWHGLLIALCGGYARNRAYRYEARLAPGATLAGFNMEQQADLIAHWFGACVLELAALQPRRAALERLLRAFRHDPRDRTLLPRKLI